MHNSRAVVVVSLSLSLSPVVCIVAVYTYIHSRDDLRQLAIACSTLSTGALAKKLAGYTLLPHLGCKSTLQQPALAVLYPSNVTIACTSPYTVFPSLCTWRASKRTSQGKGRAHVGRDQYPPSAGPNTGRYSPPSIPVL